MTGVPTTKNLNLCGNRYCTTLEMTPKAVSFVWLSPCYSIYQNSDWSLPTHLACCTHCSL